RTTCKAFELDAAVYERLLDVKEDKVKLGDIEIVKLFKDYLRESRKLSKLVDELGG
ncbi:MAG: hypothetical protein HQ551_06145, partial [Desulfobacteraceae bacterium]|nr:hypothetical protein [Desulfobacteraceae bacterium]